MTRLSLTGWMLIAMAAGAGLGFLRPDWALSLSIFTNIFLRLIRSIVAPVLFGVLVRAMAGSGGARGFSRIGWKALLYFELTSSLALLTGWLVCALVQPGRGITLHAEASRAGESVDFGSIIVGAFPASIIEAMARSDVMQITLFCLLFGLACSAAGKAGVPMLRFADAVTETAFRYTAYIMLFAPVAVFAAMAQTVAQNRSGGAFAGLAAFVGAAWLAQVIFTLTVQAASVRFARIPLATFARQVREPFVVAFATTSSAAALPQTLAALKRMGIPEHIVGIVAPLSLSFNLCGSCIHLAMCALFAAQAANIDLSAGQQLLILATLKLTSKGVAGIPRANFVVLTGLFSTFHLPAETLTVLLGLDALIDPVRTSVNVLGHCAAPPVVAHWEGESLQNPVAGAIPTTTDK